jgi:hypothetical protein
MSDGQEFDLFAEVRRGKRERQEALGRALTASPGEPDPVVAEVELDLLADAVAELLVGRLEPEPEPGYFDAALHAKATRERRAGQPAHRPRRAAGTGG